MSTAPEMAPEMAPECSEDEPRAEPESGAREISVGLSESVSHTESLRLHPYDAIHRALFVRKSESGQTPVRTRLRLNGLRIRVRDT